MRLQIVGRGRMAAALTAVLKAGGAGSAGGAGTAGVAGSADPEITLLPRVGRGATGLDADGRPADVVLLAVPDAAIATAASLIEPGPLVGHLSGATALDVLAPHEAFSLHPLQTVTGPETTFEGAFAAVAATSARGLGAAKQLATVLGLAPFEIADRDRAAYHAASSIASNFLVTLEGFAEQLAATAGVPREALVPMVRATVENWASQGAMGALTGPIARGDEVTVARQRAAVAERLPRQLDLFDALTDATRRLAGGQGS